MKFAWVPFPAPGPPNKMTLMIALRFQEKSAPDSSQGDHIAPGSHLARNAIISQTHAILVIFTTKTTLIPPCQAVSNDPFFRKNRPPFLSPASTLVRRTLCFFPLRYRPTPLTDRYRQEKTLQPASGSRCVRPDQVKLIMSVVIVIMALQEIMTV